MTADPLGQLSHWLPGIPGSDNYFPVMTLATVDRTGAPDVRTMLLSEITEQGLVFHTDRQSRKVAQLLSRRQAACLLTIPELARQIAVAGQVVQLDDGALAAGYAARSRYLQLLAWLNTAEMARPDDVERQRRWAEFDAAHPDGTLTAPPGWTGFTLRPDRITFWQGDTEAPSRRTEYTRTDTGWSTIVLPG